MNEWPKEVPILTAKDICRRWLKLPTKQEVRCLLGWTFDIFGMGQEMIIVEKLLAKRCRKPIDEFNDDPKNSKTKIAQIWNDTMKEMGSTTVTETYKI